MLEDAEFEKTSRIPQSAIRHDTEPFHPNSYIHKPYP
jgi:hypothetical protein